MRGDIISQWFVEFWENVISKWFVELGKVISQWFVEFWVSFPMPLELPQSDIWAESYCQNTETCAESKFESNPILTPIWEIPI